MINTYSYYDSEVNKLNEFVLAFFNRIEFEIGDFSVEFFEDEFYDNLVRRHSGILLRSFQEIYEITKNWTQDQRTELCNAIRNSNEIEGICCGDISPSKSNQIPNFIKDLFVSLYDDVLFKKIYAESYGNRKEHYHEFRRIGNNSFIMCPACGIRPMHNSVEDITDQYDHYLPKDIYPLSSVNFKNLVPVCSDCNSILVKSNDDILSHTGKVFFPFDINHQPLSISITMSKNDKDLEKVEWSIEYESARNKIDELTAWKAIYKIESRHKEYCKGNITGWYKFYWEYSFDSDTMSEIPDENIRKRNYLRSKQISNSFEFQCLSAILTKETDIAIVQAKIASRYN